MQTPCAIVGQLLTGFLWEQGCDCHPPTSLPQQVPPGLGRGPRMILAPETATQAIGSKTIQAAAPFSAAWSPFGGDVIYDEVDLEYVVSCPPEASEPQDSATGGWADPPPAPEQDSPVLETAPESGAFTSAQETESPPNSEAEGPVVDASGFSALQTSQRIPADQMSSSQHVAD